MKKKSLFLLLFIVLSSVLMGCHMKRPSYSIELPGDMGSSWSYSATGDGQVAYVKNRDRNGNPFLFEFAGVKEGEVVLYFVYSDPSVTIQPLDISKTVFLEVDERGVIHEKDSYDGHPECYIFLEGNPTTGYEWEYTMDREGIVEEVSVDYRQDPAASDMVGVGGEYTYIFRALSPGEVTLQFIYTRPGEVPDQALEKTIKVDQDIHAMVVESKKAEL